jgi:WD40 repeat protein
VCGRYFVCENNGKAVAIDLQTGEESRAVLNKGKLRTSYSLGMSPTGEYYYHTNGLLQTLVVERRTGNVIHRIGDNDPPGKVTDLGKVSSCGFSANGKYFYYSCREENGYVLRVWDLAARQVVDTFPLLTGSVYDIANGKALLFAGGPGLTSPQAQSDLNTIGVSAQLRMWDLEKRAEIGTIPRKSFGPQLIRIEVAYCPNHRIIAICGGRQGKDKTFQLWDLSTGKHLASFDLVPFEVVFSPDGSKLAVQTLSEPMNPPVLHLIDVPGKKQIWRLDLSPQKVFFTSDSRQLIVAADRALHYVDVSTGAVKKTIRALGYIGDPKFTHDQRHLTFEDFRPIATPKNDSPPGLGNPANIVPIGRFLDLDSSQEVLRVENWHPVVCVHFPPDRRSMVFILFGQARNEDLVFNLHCLEVHQQ